MKEQTIYYTAHYVDYALLKGNALYCSDLEGTLNTGRHS